MHRSLPWLVLLALSAACGFERVPFGGSSNGDEAEPEPDPEPKPDAEPDPTGTTGSDGPGGGSSSGEDPGFEFIMEPDGGTGLECDVWSQDCPAGEKCMPWADDGGNAWNAYKCTEVAHAPDGLRQPCTVVGSGVSGVDSCDVGMMCWDVDPETNEGVCVALCSGSEAAPTCADPFQTCSVGKSLSLCFDQCEPLAQDCPVGCGCYYSSAFGDDFQCAPDASGELGAVGDACGFVNDCDPGNVCVMSELLAGCESASCCSNFCDLGGDDCGTDSCIPFYAEGTAPPGLENLGTCGAAP